MILSEIVRSPLKVYPQEKTPKISPDTHPTRFPQVELGFGRGAGLTPSGVYHDKKHPDRIIKVVRIRNTNDSYLRFIRMIEQHQNNPYFPRIFGYKVNKVDSNGVYSIGGQDLMLYVAMEKLDPMRKFPIQTRIKLLDDIGLPYDQDRPTTGIADYMMDDRNRRRVKNATPDSQFKQALRLLEPMFNKYGSDLHMGNFMVRSTGDNLQLVLIDPLAPSSDTEVDLDMNEFDNWGK